MRVSLPLPNPPLTLNDAQMQAVRHLSGPCLVLAGAGSGKTRVIVQKISRLLASGIAPKQIAAITFTNKAAQEMRERAKVLVGAKAARDLAISTFHSLGVRMLRADGAVVGLKPNFSILDSDDVLNVIKDAGATTDKALAKRWQWAISLWKNQGLTAETALATAASAEEQHIAVLMQRYQERLQAFQAVDFDDLIQLPLCLLQRNEEARGRWQGQFKHVLVDEYQDTNAVQYELLKALVGTQTPFTAVGDDDQSIYGWRGATIDNLKRLPLEFPQLRVIALEQNYRSTGLILQAANAVISHNPKAFEKKLWSELGDGEPVRVLECDNEAHEAERAVARIQSLRGADARIAFSDFAVLYRANHQAKVLEQKLRDAQIPYKVSGGQSYFDRAEIKDLCAWLRLWVNNDDDPAFVRAITSPKRGIGHQTLATLGEFAGRWKCSLFEALFAPSLPSVMKGKALDGLLEFGRSIHALEEKARITSGSSDAKTMLLDWLKDIAYEQHVHDGAEGEKLGAARWGNVLDFVDWIARRCGGTPAEDEAIAASNEQSVWEVAQTISIIISLADRDETQDVVTLSTLHAAKGLEWMHVVLAGVNEGLLPFKSDAEDMTEERLAEERRLMYVGITRAQRSLCVSVLRRRKKGRETIVGVPSRFVAEMQLDKATLSEDPRVKLKRLRDEMAARIAAAPALGGQN